MQSSILCFSYHQKKEKKKYMMTLKNENILEDIKSGVLFALLSEI